MEAAGIFLRGQLTRSIFAIFLVFALLPVCVLSFVAVAKLSEATDEQVSRVLENEVQNFSYLILTRLEFAREMLEMQRQELASMSDSELAKRPDIYLTTEELLLGLRPLSFIHQDELAGVHDRLAQGRPILLRRLEGNQLPSMYMAVALDNGNLERGLLSVRLNPEFVLGDWESRNLAIDTCVIGTTRATLFATSAGLCNAFLAQYGGSLGHKGQVSFQDNDNYFARYRGLFLEDKFGVENWKIAIMQPRHDIFSGSQEFRNNLVVIAVTTIMILCVVCLLMIRNRMEPLNKIMAGIERISYRNYDEPVLLSSGDEFEDMANALNSMSDKVSRQMVTLASMAQIDQLILTRMKREDIVRIVLERTRDVLHCSEIRVVMLSEGSAGAVYSLAGQGKRELVTAPVNIPEQYKLPAKSGFWLDHADTMAMALFKHFRSGVRSIYALPVQGGETPSALILLGYQHKPKLDSEEIETARTYTDRIAVALENADWEDRLYHQAHYDSLTELPNRRSMLDRLEQAVTQAKRSGESFAVMFIDLDDFKLVNDALGHHYGDEMITEVGKRLRSNVRSGETVARMGGDEFVMISSFFANDDDAATSMSQVAGKIIQEVARPLLIGGREVRSSSSIGITVFPRDGDNPETLLRNADTAMYHAKSRGRGKFKFFSQKLNAESMALMSLSSDLKRALEGNEFELHFQPKVDLKTMKVIGAEALIRWNHPTRGMIPPGEFITVAERMGLIGHIGDWTLHKACEHISQWRARGLQVPRISVNVSAIQIHRDDLPSKIAAALRDYDLEPGALEIEIVEGVFVEDIESAGNVLSEIRKLGVHVSIDDYGTGYSSLSYVRSFPVDTLKIDKCFIDRICDNSADRAIVTSTIVLAHNLNMTVLAEGVETAGQASMLRDIGCDQMQGYYISRPIPADRVGEIFETRASLRIVKDTA